MATAKEAHNSICGKLGLKPLTKENILYFYLPAQGVLSYTALSVNVMNPSLILRVFPKRDITNILLANTLLGTGLYLYNKKHLQLAPKEKRIMYSGFGAVCFTLGSVLMWAIARSVLPNNITVCTVAGIGSGIGLIKLGCSYVSHMDSLVKA